MKFKDLQTGEYYSHSTLHGLVEKVLDGYCECGEGHDFKDGQCYNCYHSSHIHDMSVDQLLTELSLYRYECM